MYKGGKFLASGGFGCVYRPALLCRGDKTTKRDYNKVSKIMKFYNAYDELEQTSYIDKIDPDFDFHMRTPVLCKLGDIDNKEDNHLNECPNIQPFEVMNTLRTYTDEWLERNKSFGDIIKYKDRLWHAEELCVLQQDYGGMPISKWFKSKDKTHLTPKLFKKLLYALEPLFRGLYKSIKKNFINIDIKDDNILYNPDTNRFIFIDFGAAGSIDNIKENHMHFFRNHYFPLPFDSILFNNYRLSSDEIIDKYFTSYNYDLHKKLFNDYNQLHNLELLKKNKQSFLDSKTQYFTNYLKAIPVYSFGIYLAEILQKFTGRLQKDKIFDNQLYNDFKNLIYDMINPDYTTRLTPIKTYYRFIKILNRFGGGGKRKKTKKYKNKSKNMRYSRRYKSKSHKRLKHK